MAKLQILYIPDPRLAQPAKPVEKIDATIQPLLDDMFETMYAVSGVGLAATQIGIDKRISVIDVSAEKNQPLVLINPEILEAKDFVDMEEGCLSVPTGSGRLKRPSWLKMRALDRTGKEYELVAEGLLAECIQHEVDHLNGTLFIDHLSRLKRQLVKDKVKKHLRLMKKKK